MSSLSLNRVPEVSTKMLIRRPIAEVFDAFANPDVTTKFWFTRSTGRLETGATVQWFWDMYGVHANVHVTAFSAPHNIAVQWAGEGQTPTLIEWTFSEKSAPKAADGSAESWTVVQVKNSGFEGDGDAVVSKALDSMGGFTFLLAGAKAYLEHGIQLNLVGDAHPA
jgi:uncharacterized protein YndB with AHSA1/START domain